MSYEMSATERRLAHLGREMMALAVVSKNDNTSAHLSRVGAMLTEVGTGRVGINDFSDLDMALLTAIAKRSKSGVEVQKEVDGGQGRPYNVRTLKRNEVDANGYYDC